MALVSTTSAYACRDSTARRTSSVSSFGSILIAGSSTGSAPSAARRRESSLACARARVTITRTPCSGLDWSHSIAPRLAATGPITVAAGGPIPASSAAAAMPSSGASTTRCSGRVPRSITAAGSAGSRPASISFSATSGSFFTPM